MTHLVVIAPGNDSFTGANPHGRLYLLTGFTALRDQLQIIYALTNRYSELWRIDDACQRLAAVLTFLRLSQQVFSILPACATVSDSFANLRENCCRLTQNLRLRPVWLIYSSVGNGIVLAIVG